MYFLLFVILHDPAAAQYTSQTYPDPRLDPLTCRLPFGSQICDPSGVLSDEDRVRLMQRMNQFRPITAGIRNTSPACALQPEKNLDLFVIIIEKIGSVPGASVDIEKFANNLKRRFQNYQDVTACDTTVLVVNSKQDRQVYTVAGRDARISKDTLKNAFERNVGHFKGGNYAMGLEGMIELIVAAYSNAHIVQVPSSVDFIHPASVETPERSKTDSELRPTPETVAPFRAAGLPNSVQSSKFPQPFSEEDIDEKDKIWVSIMQQAVARCGGQPESLGMHVRAVAEEEQLVFIGHRPLYTRPGDLVLFFARGEAMAISLKLIADPRYNSIEEDVETHKDVVGVREQAWDTAKEQFILPLFRKYNSLIAGSSQQTCPVITLKNL